MLAVTDQSWVSPSEWQEYTHHNDYVDEGRLAEAILSVNTILGFHQQTLKSQDEVCVPIEISLSKLYAATREWKKAEMALETAQQRLQESPEGKENLLVAISEQLEQVKRHKQ